MGVMTSLDEIEELCEDMLGQIFAAVDHGYTLKEANRIYSGTCLLAYLIQETEVPCHELQVIGGQLENLILEMAPQIDREPPDWLMA